jgi:hypothetical protein
LTQSFQPHYGPGVDSASNRNEYQEYFLGRKGSQCVGLTTLPPHVPTVFKSLEPQAPGTLRAWPRPVMGLLCSFDLLYLTEYSLWVHCSNLLLSVCQSVPR